MIPIKELFNTSYGTKFDLNKMELTSQEDSEGVNFVARTARNLGVSATVKPYNQVKPHDSGLITVALGGSILSSFVQKKPFYTAQNIMVLIPKKKMSFQEKVFYCQCIEHNKFRFSAFGREANRTLKDILIPENPPIWVNDLKMTDYSSFSLPINSTTIELEMSKWQWFRYDKLFNIERGRGPRVKDIQENGTTPFITSIDKNNGLTGWTNDSPIHSGNVISVNRNGSVAEAFYQPVPFCSTEDVHIFNPKFNLNPFIALFLVSLIKKEKYRYSYGRKWGIGRMNESQIKLPITETGEPDWKFMENYIKSLPYSKSL